MPPDAPCPSKELLRRSLDPDDPMPEPERQQVGAHVDQCAKGCKEVIGALLRGDTLAAGPEATRPVEAADAAPPEFPVPSIPGYEVLGELGRGGMGVVYKARQVGLNRLVALKMILAGSYASPDGRARFRTEAEAVAALQHPNIVQIHEIGEWAGAPYITLEYVEGGTLAHKLGGAPQPARQAAEAAETLARAVESAHRRGVVHRDLKPANVLLTADGTLKITDFGLAKRLEEEAGQTRTGEVVGTPSYMAPEQAAGRPGKVGPACDVYALGAILYELLTGRPPFRGPTGMDTLLQLLHDDPVPPRQLQPKTPRDLETICLKCLEKDPLRRYARSADLADDLRRFLGHEPILARPVGPWKRAAKWARRRPAVAVSLAVAVVSLIGGTVASTSFAVVANERASQLEKSRKDRAQAQVDALLNAGPGALPAILQNLRLDQEAVLPRLRELWDDRRLPERQRPRVALALLPVDPSQVDYLYDSLLEAEPDEVGVFVQQLSTHKGEFTERLWAVLERPEKGREDRRLRAAAALAAYDPDGERWDRAAGPVIEQLVQVNPAFLAAWMAAFRPAREKLLVPLAAAFQDRREGRAGERNLAASVLADYAADRPDLLADLVMDADDKQFAILRPMLEKNSQEVQAALTAELSNQAPARENEVNRIARARRQANAAATLVALGAPGAAWTLLKHTRTPDARTVLIHGLAPRGARARGLIRRLEEEKDDSIRAALILALGEYTAEQLPPEVRAGVTPTLLAWYRDDPDPGVHGAIDWLLRHGKEGPMDRPLDWEGRVDLEKIDAELAGKPGPAGRGWYVNGQRQTFTAVRGPAEFLMGSPEDEPGRADDETLHRRTIGRSFAVASKPVIVAQWETFMEAMKKAKVEVGQEYTKKYAPEPDCPILNVTWYEAAMYCRWLSEMERMPERQMVYPPITDVLKCADGQTSLKLPKDYLARTGYRLPTEAEFEYASRADTATRWSFGGAEEFLPRHGWFVKNGEDRTWPAGQKKPNERGLFDVQGGVWVWCQGGYQRYNPAGMEDNEDDRSIMDGVNCVLRGGAFSSPAWVVRSANRNRAVPSYRNYNVGFRLARTLPPDYFVSLPPP